MNFKDLLENECGGANPLMRLGNQLTSDTTLRDDGISSNFRDINFQPENVSFKMTFDFDNVNLDFLDFQDGCAAQ